ncbi:MAG TPA: NAD(P)-dependent alcohol dehydrogenase [Nitrospiraceae bacterium]|nr:NAD(P)-dependent alcohol dehydrogenase [Nitrospiraceae bacterium]
MKVYQIHSYSGPDGLTLVERPEPIPAAGQILIRVRAASLNYRDLMVVRGEYGGSQRTNLIPLSDGAGEVIGVGEGVTRVKIGDRVAGNVFQTWLAGDITSENMKEDLGVGIDGMLAQYVMLSADGVVHLPPHLTYEEGATLPCAALTAWNALVVQGGVKAGDTVLILGTGGVAIFALQFAKLHGARVIVTSGSDVKLSRARALGADETINYTDTPHWERTVWELTGKRGVDHVIEVGGAGTLEKSLRSVRYGGRVSLIGVLSGLGGTVNPLPVLFKSVTMQGIYIGSREMFETMNRAITQAALKPLIDRVFPFAEAPEAYRYLHTAAHMGKVVIGMDDRYL